eukprot:scaffold183271_cov14-Tisochrysis_lutea.AAC.1
MEAHHPATCRVCMAHTDYQTGGLPNSNKQAEQRSSSPQNAKEKLPEHWFPSDTLREFKRIPSSQVRARPAAQM